MKLTRVILACVGAALLSGCVTDHYVEGSGFVKAGTKLPAKKQCKFEGNVSSQYGSDFAGQFMNTQSMQYKALKYLKGAAAKKGGNFVLITQQQAQNTGVFGSTTHIKLQGKAYYCK